MTPTLYTPIPRFGVGNHPDFSGAFGDLPIVSHQIQPLIKVSIKQLVYKKNSGSLLPFWSLCTPHTPQWLQPGWGVANTGGWPVQVATATVQRSTRILTKLHCFLDEFPSKAETPMGTSITSSIPWETLKERIQQLPLFFVSFLALASPRQSHNLTPSLWISTLDSLCQRKQPQPAAITFGLHYSIVE